MANESKSAHKGKVTIGANTVLGMGTWSWSGEQRELIDDIDFTDEYDSAIYGMLRCGTVSFNGNYKKDDTQGQDILRSCKLNRSNLTDIRFYVDSVSYLTPNNTTAAGGGLLAETPIGHVKVETHDVNFSMPGNLGKTSFNVRICDGPLRLI